MPYSVRASVFAGLLLFSGLVGCGPSVPSRVRPDLPDSSAASKAMELYDTDHDGFLDDKELEQVPGLKAAKKVLDTNHDGKISEQEIRDRIKYWADLNMVLPVVCRVTHNGQPLAGAKVVFVPEKFLGGTLKSGSGTTVVTGYARISSPYPADPSVQGVSPGFYRVEITKDGEPIPAKYNSKTILGTEVPSGSSCAEQNETGFNFTLQY